MEKHFIHPERREILSVFQVFPCTTQIALFWPKLSLPFSLRSLDIPAFLKSWQKHYLVCQWSADTMPRARCFTLVVRQAFVLTETSRFKGNKGYTGFPLPLVTDKNKTSTGESKGVSYHHIAQMQKYVSKGTIWRQYLKFYWAEIQ
jgi:hypothetical protein